ncbi:MAG: zinc ribbon domain-containing protein [Candidatus Micrarchaeota archaeon]|nr:zinc ribbon domain-containing protein [Candidatus Micrarchaeota archaeon]
MFVRVAGYDKDVGLLKNGREEGEIDGLRKDDAKRLADYISRRLQGRDDISSPRQNQAPAQQSNARFCIKCGASLQAGANFCPSCGAKVS